ncbi:MAG: hypothetical protein HQK69_00595 [Desulfamplus sp.]|nr:hypothetical protein [Desulfamplus sp.]
MVNRYFSIVVATLMEIKPLLSCSNILSDTITTSGIRIIKANLTNPSYSDNLSCSDCFEQTPQTLKNSNFSIEFTVIITGIGVINAAHALTVYLESLIDSLKIDNFNNNNSFLNNNKSLFIIQTGIAGFFKDSGLKIGDIAVAASEVYTHLDLVELMDNRNNRYLINQHKYYSFDNNIVEKSRLIIEGSINSFQKKEFACNVVSGGFVTVSTITSTNKDADNIFKLFNKPCMESMEGAASAHIAALYNIPFLEVRAASNVVGIRDKKEWKIPLACERVSFAIKAILVNGTLNLKE